MKHIRPTHRRAAGIAAAALLALPLIAACGSDDDGDSDGGSASGADGDPIKVMTYGPIDAQGFSIPGIETGAQAGVDKVNEDGGINGRPLELIVCNDNNDPNTAAGCARQAVQEKVVAVIGGLSTFEPQLLPVLDEAGIPVVGLTAVSTFNLDNLYPIAGGAPATLFALGKYMATAPACEGKVASVLEDFAAVTAANQLTQLGVMASGGSFEGEGKAPQGATDFAPAVSSALEKARCITYLAGPQTTPIITQALAANGGAVEVGTSDTSMPAESIKALGATADGTRVFAAYLPLSDATDTPEMKEFLERGRKIDENFSPDQTAASGYLAALVLQEALDGVDVKNLTSADVVEALDGLSGYETGLGPVIDFTDQNPTKAFSRLPYAATMYPWIAKDGEYVLDEATEPLSISEIYDAASAAGQ